MSDRISPSPVLDVLGFVLGLLGLLSLALWLPACCCGPIGLIAGFLSFGLGGMGALIGFLAHSRNQSYGAGPGLGTIGMVFGGIAVVVDVILGVLYCGFAVCYIGAVVANGGA